jgi:heat shock protein HslJ
MKKLIIFIVGALCIFSLFFNCSLTTTPEPDNIVPNAPFYESKWVLKQLKGKAITLKTGTMPYIVFGKESKNANGKSPCNTFEGSFACDYIGDGAYFSMANITTTKVSCGVNAQIETDFYQALQKADAVYVVGKQLQIKVLSPDNEILALLETQ